MEENPERLLIAELMADNRNIPSVRTIIPNGTLFANQGNGALYDVLLSAFDAHGLADLVTMESDARRRGIEVHDLAEVMTMAVSGEYAGHHAKVIAEQYMRRMGRDSLANLVAGFDSCDNVFEALNAAICKLLELQQQFKKDQAVSLAIVSHEVCQYLEELASGKRTGGLPFCFPEIDDVTGGMDETDLVVLAGLEKSGKSTLMIQTLFATVTKGIPAVLFSTEMSRNQVLLRMACIEERLLWHRVKKNLLDKAEWRRLLKRVHRYSSLPLFIRDGVQTITDIMADAQRLAGKHLIGLIAVDYIQRVVPVNKRANENREREVAAISSGLKNMALSLKVPVLALSQLNEEMRARESRSIEQDMDKMITLDRRSEDDRNQIVIGDRLVVKFRVRQRLGLSTAMGDPGLELHYDLVHGYWVSPRATISDSQNTQKG